MNADTSAAVFVDAANSRLEDIYIQGASTSSQDGILVGSRLPAYTSAILNVHGYGLKNVVHLYSPSTPSINATDVTILGSACSGSSAGVCPANNIQDDLPGGATLTATNVGMYIVGEPIAGTSGATVGYSRFTTTPSSTSATWLVGTVSLTSGSSCSSAGSLYSCTSNSSCGSGTTLWACEGSAAGWVPIE
jgi:hypothetical protein